MAVTNNMKNASVNYVPYYNDKVHRSSSFHLSSHCPLSISTTPSDLPGFLCTIGPHHLNSFTENQCQCDFSRDSSHAVPIDFPPSPPPTNYEPKRSVPLPRLDSNAEAGPSSPISSRNRRTKESPISVALGFSNLMTPPPTLPTPTVELPPTGVELSPIPTEHDGWDASLLSLPSASSSPDRDNHMYRLLSPISPEWPTNGISYNIPTSPPISGENTSVLLSGNRHHLFEAPGSFPYLQQSDDNNTSPHCRPILPLLDIPFELGTPRSSWSDSPTSSMDYDDELDMLATPCTFDMDMPSSPKSLPSTPFAHEHELSYEPDSQLFGDDFSDDKYGYILEPHNHEFFLPELDDIPNSPSSPSLRSFSMLPALEDDDDYQEYDTYKYPSSPTSTLISLPGADTDDFLFPPDLEPQNQGRASDIPPSPFEPGSSSLLLLEDEPLPRSPSPENYDVDPASVEESSDPDIRHLAELRRKSHNSERAARQLEHELLFQGAVHQRWEARRARKKEQERGREIGAMLRLKLADERKRSRGAEADTETEGEREGERSMKRRKGTICSMEQLVARMMLRRNDTYRSLANRKTPLTSKFHTSSPLVRYGDFLIESDDEFDSPISKGTSDFDHEPWTPPTSAWTSSGPQISSSSF